MPIKVEEIKAELVLSDSFKSNVESNQGTVQCLIPLLSQLPDCAQNMYVFSSHLISVNIDMARRRVDIHRIIIAIGSAFIRLARALVTVDRYVFSLKCFCEISNNCCYFESLSELNARDELAALRRVRGKYAEEIRQITIQV